MFNRPPGSYWKIWLLPIIFLTATMIAQPGLGQSDSDSNQVVPLDLKKVGKDSPIADVFKAIKSKDEIVKVLAEEPKPDKPKPEITVYIMFKVGTAELADDRSKKQLDEAGRALASSELNGYKFEIAGHTDSTGQAQYNLNLSKIRAQAVKDYLAANYHIEPTRLNVQGYGDTKPMAVNDTEANRALNRRVVFSRLN
ncbi:MAG: OmpA family protein [Deltaproteobacteria bacterium]|nr:OmpA family protein [Deltaproteobacteria bacterium]